jgi:hypothetical protein
MRINNLKELFSNRVYCVFLFLLIVPSLFFFVYFLTDPYRWAYSRKSQTFRVLVDETHNEQFTTSREKQNLMQDAGVSRPEFDRFKDFVNRAMNFGFEFTSLELYPQNLTGKGSINETVHEIHGTGNWSVGASFSVESVEPNSIIAMFLMQRPSGTIEISVKNPEGSFPFALDFKKDFAWLKATNGDWLVYVKANANESNVLYVGIAPHPPITCEELMNYDILILSGPCVWRSWAVGGSGQFLDAEIDAISRFVESGRGLFILHDIGGDGRGPNLNSLTSMLDCGIVFNSDMIQDHPSNDSKVVYPELIISEFAEHPITKDIIRIRLAESCSLNVSAPSQSIAFTKNDSGSLSYLEPGDLEYSPPSTVTIKNYSAIANVPSASIIAVFQQPKEASGRIVALGDLDLLSWNKAGEFDNWKLGTNILKWLSPAYSTRLPAPLVNFLVDMGFETPFSIWIIAIIPLLPRKETSQWVVLFTLSITLATANLTALRISSVPVGMFLPSWAFEYAKPFVFMFNFAVLCIIGIAAIKLNQLAELSTETKSPTASK